MSDEFEHRFAAAKSAKSDKITEDGFEVYKYCFNGREDEWTGKNARFRDPEEIFADCVAGIAEDFSGDLFHTMTPENADWVEYETGMAVPEDQEQAVVDFMRRREKTIAKALTASNYYDEGPTAFQDANFGTVALWSERHTLSSPITFEAVPCSELYLRLGPFGIDDRFRENKYFYRDLPQLFPEAEFSAKMKAKIKKGGKGKAKVVRGFWRTFNDPGNPIWVRRYRVDTEEIGMDADLEGEGSCPLTVGRFNAVPNSPWGRGPARRMLPTLRTLDELVRMNLENMDHTLDPSVIYPNDGVLDLSEGLEAGIGYPAMPGTAESVQTIGGGDLDAGYFVSAEIKEEIRDGFYRDLPQKGKTPPSASQYMGEEQKQVRRMARPAGKLWKELGVGVLKRVEYLETTAGGSLDGEKFRMLDEQLVSIRPISPLERAQAREEVLVAQSIMGMAQESLGPQMAPLLIDGITTMGNIKKVLKDKIVIFRTPDQLKEVMAQMQPQQGAQGEPETNQG